MYSDEPAQQMEIAKSLGGVSLRNPPIRKRMEMQRAELVQRIEYIDRALELLDQNPGIEAFQDVMGKLGHL